VAARECFDSVRAAYPNAHVFGCTSGGEIHGAHVDDDTFSATAVRFDHAQVVAARSPVMNADDSFAAGARLARQLKLQGLRHVIVLSEGLLVNASELVEGLNSVLPRNVSVSGGFAADGNRLQQTFVWCDSGPTGACVVALGFYGERLNIGVAATGGWGVFGPDRLITKSRKNVLYEFDGKPALALYKQYLGAYAAELPAVGLMFPLDLRTQGEQHRVLRALLAVDEAAQSITYAGNVPEGCYARFMIGRVHQLIDGASDAARSSLRHLRAPAAQLSLLVSCNARRMVLKQRVEEEVEAVNEILGGSVLTGFYSYGEIAPARSGGTAELHNETMTITTFAET
jgi:hypothetical protein